MSYVRIDVRGGTAAIDLRPIRHMVKQLLRPLLGFPHPNEERVRDAMESRGDDADSWDGLIFLGKYEWERRPPVCVFDRGLLVKVMMGLEAEGFKVDVNNTDRQYKHPPIGFRLPEGYLRTYQAQVASKAAKVARMRGYASLQMPTASGKTRVAHAITTIFDCPTVILVPSCALGYQWVKDFTEIGIEAGYAFDGRFRLGKVMVCTYQTVYSAMERHKLEMLDLGLNRNGKKNRKRGFRWDDREAVVEFSKKDFVSLKNLFGLLIVDEMHMLGSDGKQALLNVCRFFECPYRVGMTATPMRYAGDDFVMYAHFGRPVVYVDRRSLVNAQYLSDIKVHILPGIGTSYEWMQGNFREGKKLVSEDEGYNRRVVKLAEFYAKEFGTAVIMVEYKKHIKLLKKMMKEQDFVEWDGKAELPLRGTNGALVFAALTGDTQGKVKEEARIALTRRHLNVVVCTNIWSVGVNIPNLSAAILASPFASPVLLAQRLGRLSRISPGKLFGHLIDFWHQHGGLVRMDRQRREFYEVAGYRTLKQ